mmetsp:Transcript_11659/g.15809  ORF Transcript_11659/g.15809 Transcript_11659/m.15809 type:complete len:112 (+) Transcript_11659:364-699(+)
MQTEDNVTTVEWYESVRCKDLYAEKIAGLPDDSAFKREFSKSEWICPKVDEISVRNDPTVYATGAGSAFEMIINKCSDALQIDVEHGLTSYETTYNCKDTDPKTFELTEEA